MTDEWLSASAAARRIGVSRQRLHLLVQAGKVAAKRTAESYLRAAIALTLEAG